MSAVTATKPDRRIRVGPALRLGVHLVAAVSLGIYADVGLDVPGPWGRLTALATPWLLLAFSAARGAGRRTCGAGAVVAGVLVVVTGLVSYYLWLTIGLGVAFSTVVHSYEAPMWVVAGVAVGAVFGAVGTLSLSSRRLLRELSWAVVAAAPMADALLTLLFTLALWDAERVVLLVVFGRGGSG
jgi:Family of unknown function (DUF6518)